MKGAPLTLSSPFPAVGDISALFALSFQVRLDSAELGARARLDPDSGPGPRSLQVLRVLEPLESSRRTFPVHLD